MNLDDKQNEIISEFSFFSDWMQKYEYIIELGKDLPLIEDKYKVDENLIKGCQSRVWLHAELDNEGKLNLSADSDAIITKGLIALVIQVLNHERPSDVAQANLYFIKEIGLSEHLSQTRSNGLSSMVQQIKNYAIAYQLKNM